MGENAQRVKLTASDGASIVVHTWPIEDPRGVVQVTHGMGEHSLRYARFAAALNAAGWTVVAQDHRGHGATAVGELGVITGAGWRGLVDDIELVRRYARTLVVTGPLVLFGHSMGSFAVQQYLPAHDELVDAVLLSGTAAVDLLEGAIDLDGPVDLSLFNGPFAPARTDFDWLSRDEAEVDKYVDDELCGFGLDGDAMRALFEGARAIADPEVLARVRKNLPVYVAVGSADPVNGNLALVDALVARLREAGLTDVTLEVYTDARHEILNEINRDDVETGFVAWLDRRFPRP